MLDLADFAAEDGRATRTLAVSFATPGVKAAAGVPAKMLITIGCEAGAPVSCCVRCSAHFWYPGRLVRHPGRQARGGRPRQDADHDPVRHGRTRSLPCARHCIGRNPLLEARTGAWPGGWGLEKWSGVLAGKLGMLTVAGSGCMHRCLACRLATATCPFTPSRVHEPVKCWAWE